MARNTYYKDEVLNEKFNAKQLKRVFKYVLPYKKTFLLSAVLMVAAIGLSLLPALFMKYIIDNILPSSDYTLLYIVVILFMFTGTLENVIHFINGRVMSKTGHKIIYNIREEIYRKLQTLSFEYFDNRPTGKILIRVTHYIDELSHFFAHSLLQFIINIVRMTVILVFLFILNYILALIIIAVLIPLTLFIMVIRTIIIKLIRNVKNKDSNRLAFTHENILGVTVTKSFNRAQRNTEIFNGLVKKSLKGWRHISFVNELFSPGVEAIWNIGTMLIYVAALYLIGTGVNVEVGTVIAFISYLGMFAAPLNQLAGIMQQFNSVSGNLERIFETMDTKPAVSDKKNAVDLTVTEGRITFDNVTFSYDGKINILENFNLDVPGGKTIALIGPTGAGKSTVINLIPRFYDVKEGSIKIDGTDVRDVTLNSLRSRVGIMMQDAFVFKDTVINNIRYANEKATDSECIEAAKKIFADDFISKLPKGYYTELSERGEGLSSGEKQLLSFARVMLCDPKILILDEATSSIDTKTELKIQKALEVLLKDRTSFVIAHRLSTIKKADCILYIADKGIKEAGTHKDLMEKQGFYYRLTCNDKNRV